MRTVTIMALMCAATAAFAQLSIVGTYPAANATNVPLSTTVSVTFSEALDISRPFDNKWGSFFNLDGITGSGFSPDQRTFSWDVNLEPGKLYFVSIYHAKAAGGALLPVPYCFHFTTGAGFPPYVVSGSISPGTTGVSPAHALVLLSLNPVGNGQDPQGFSGVIADADGNFTFPYVGNGTYWPVAAKDVNADGDINPRSGDAIAFGDSIIVSGGNFSGLPLVFQKFEPLGFRAAINIAQNHASSLPLDRSLRMVMAWGPDTQGRSSEWEFDYVSQSSTPPGYSIYVRSDNNYMEPIDQWRYDWVNQMQPLGNLSFAAEASAFMAKVEASGGQAYRTKSMPDSLEFESYILLGDLEHSELWQLISDPTKQYWGAVYMFAVNHDSTSQRYEEMKFLGDYSTGDILGTTSVDPSGASLHPDQVALEQNYPNPFNPTTKIQFSLVNRQLTIVKVYDILGSEVASLVNEVKEPGTYTVEFDATGLAGGVYFYKLHAGDVTFTKKLLLLR